MQIADVLSPQKMGALIILLLLLTAGFGFWLRQDHKQITQLQRENLQLIDARDRAEAETKTALNAVKLNNDVSQATHDQKQNVTEGAQQSIVYIRRRFSADICANTHVDSLSVKRLHDYANSLRSGSGSTVTR